MSGAATGDEDRRAGEDGPREGAGERIEPVSAWETVTNEFTSAQVRKVRTRNGERLEIVSRKLGTRILLDPLELESLTWQTPATFSRMLQDPYGPEHVATEPLSRLLSDGADVSFDEDSPDG